MMFLQVVFIVVKVSDTEKALYILWEGVIPWNGTPCNSTCESQTHKAKTHVKHGELFQEKTGIKCI